jgi:hypothetical protein
MKNRLFISAIMVIMAFFFVANTYTHAQTSKNGLSLTPLTFEYFLKDGDTKTGTFYLSNIGDKDLNIKTGVKNFIAQGEDGEVSLTGESKRYALASWITISPQTATLPAKSQKIPFTYTITVPDKPEPGGHFGSVVFSTEPNANLKQTGANVSQEVAGLIFVETPGDIKEKANIESFASDNPFYEFGPVNFTVRVKNDSTIHIKPIGQITITDLLGQKDVINVETRNVLPEAIRKIPASWEQKLLLGPYTAEVNLRYGSNGKTLTAKAYFFGFPVKWGIGILIVLLIVFFAGRLSRKKT